MTNKYNEALHAAQEELGKLEERRSTLLRLIQSLKELSGDENYELTPPPGYVPKGMTEEIRTILGLTTVPLDAMQIRDSMITRGFDATSPKNLLISVHTVLGRIANELEIVEREGGKKAYKVRGLPFSVIQSWAELEAKKASSTPDFIAKVPKKK